MLKQQWATQQNMIAWTLQGSTVIISPFRKYLLLKQNVFRNAHNLVTAHLYDLIWASLDPTCFRNVKSDSSLCGAPVRLFIFNNILMKLGCPLVEGRTGAHIAQRDLGHWHPTLEPQGSPHCVARKPGLDMSTGATDHSYQHTKPHLVLQIHLRC